MLPAKYLNRLSDLLFILSRVANPDGDVLWQPGGACAKSRSGCSGADRLGRAARAATAAIPAMT